MAKIGEAGSWFSDEELGICPGRINTSQWIIANVCIKSKLASMQSCGYRVLRILLVPFQCRRLNIDFGKIY